MRDKRSKCVKKRSALADNAETASASHVESSYTLTQPNNPVPIPGQENDNTVVQREPVKRKATASPEASPESKPVGKKEKMRHDHGGENATAPHMQRLLQPTEETGQEVWERTVPSGTLQKHP